MPHMVFEYCQLFLTYTDSAVQQPRLRWLSWCVLDSSLALRFGIGCISTCSFTQIGLLHRQFLIGVRAVDGSVSTLTYSYSSFPR